MTSSEPPISLEGIIKSIQKGTLPPTHQLDPKTSQIVIQSFSKNLNETVIETLGRSARATELNLAELPMSELHIRLLQTQNLKSLVLGDSKDLAKYQNDEELIDLDALLKDALNESSRQNLTNLDLGPGEEFVDGWTQKLAQLLPSLTHLSLHNRRMEHPVLTFPFPNLEYLDISNTDFYHVGGICTLRNLRTLRIGCVLPGLFPDGSVDELQELRVLSLGCSKPNGMCVCQDFNVYWDLENMKKLPKLEFVDVSNLGIKDDQVQAFLRNQASVKTISVCNTKVKTLAYPNVTVLHCETIQAALQSLKFYLDHKDTFMIIQILNRIDNIFMNSDNNTSQEDIQNCWRAVCSVLEEFNGVEEVRESGISCFEQVMEFACLEDVPNEDRLQAIQILSDSIALYLPSLPLQQWAAIQPWFILENRELIMDTPNVDYDRLAFLAMLFLETHCDEDRDTRPYVVIFDWIMDQVDVESERFEMCNVVEILSNLQITSKERVLDITIRNAAKRVAKFVLNNFPVLEI